MISALARLTPITLAALTLGLAAPALATNRPQAEIPALKATFTTDLAQAAGDILLQTSGRLESGDSILQDGSFYDSYPFEGEAGQTVTIQLESSDFDTYLLLTDSEGNALIENDDISSSNFNSALTYTLPSSGTYNAIANSYDATGRGNYQITVTLGSAGGATTAGNARQLYQQGAQLWQQGQLQAALDRFEQALSLYAAMGDAINTADTQIALAIVANGLGQYDTAATYLEPALATVRALGNRTLEAKALNVLGLVYRNRGQYDTALTYYQQALDLHRVVDGREGEAIALNNIGDLYRAQGDYPQALDYLNRALNLQRQLGDPREIATTLNNLGTVRAAQGNYRAAIVYYEEALELIEAVGDRNSQGTLLGNIGVMYGYQGRYPESLDYQQQALDLARQAGNQEGEANALNNLGLVYNQLGQQERSLTYFEAALVISREIGDRAGEGVYLQNIGGVYDEQGDKLRSLEILEESLAIRRGIGDRAGEGQVLNNLGTVYDDLDRYDEALAAYNQSLAISQGIGDRYTEGRTLANIGLVYAKQGQSTQALDFFSLALDIFDETQDQVAQASTLRRVADLQFKSGQLPQAQTTLIATVELLESIRAGDLSDAERVALFETQRDVYMLYQQVLIGQDQFGAALEVAEQGRSRAFAELLVTKLDGGDALDRTAKPPTLREIQAIAQQQNTTLVEYSIIEDLIEDKAQLYIWVVSPAGELAFRSVPLTTTGAGELALANLVNQTRGTVGSGNRGLGVVAATAAVGGNHHYQALYQQLIAPIAALLPRDPEANVAFIPQGELFQVPFPALRSDTGQDLIETHTILTAPSIQVLGLTQALATMTEPLNEQVTLVVGNPTMPTLWSPQQGGTYQVLPPLPGAQREATAIAALLNIDPLVGSAATESTVKQAMTQAEVIHLATHGLLEYGDVQDSGVRDVPGAIALAPGNGEDGLLTAGEILDLPLNADLVVLSACDTGLGRITGDGVIGLSRSLITAGTPSVVVSLWAIPDAPTAELMTVFYEQLTAGQNKAQALRQAMLATRQNHPDPRNWAAFTLIGSAD
ncbi:MAG: tetratricopeptide repeat protein [Cyanobacteria bacterium]|nr:tetratricopeptide repeat protein [Cyanobacteriota bacterium]